MAKIFGQSFGSSTEGNILFLCRMGNLVNSCVPFLYCDCSFQSDIKESQKKLIDQLTSQISERPGPPTRKLLARCLSTIFSVGDTYALFETINKCNDIVRNRDDSPSYLPTRLYVNLLDIFSIDI